ncbi:kinase-like protein [Serendipita vermifera]|nr:kinase-like protein [Serendipita vermifera]
MRVWASLEHENILPFHGYCRDFGAYGASISPWCENGHAEHYIRRNSIEAPQRFKLWCNVIDGLAYLHSRQVVHGDLKPSNIMIDDEGNARICDFGLVRILSDESNGKTMTSTYNGTPRYLAHELVSADRPVPTFATDIHALGCVGLDFIFLRSPHASCRNICKLYNDIGRGVPPATKAPVSGDPPEPIKKLWSLLERCWNISPEKRPSATEVQEFVMHDGVALEEAFTEGFSLSQTS